MAYVVKDKERSNLLGKLTVFVHLQIYYILLLVSLKNLCVISPCDYSTCYYWSVLF